MTIEVNRQRTDTPVQGLIARPGEGKVYRVMGMDCMVLARNVDTGFVCDVMQAVFPPQSVMPAHSHHHSDEAVFVLQGELVLEVGGRTVNATQGTFGYILGKWCMPCTTLVARRATFCCGKALAWTARLSSRR